MAKASLLVVEDEKTAAEFIRAALERERYVVSVAATGLAARRAVEKAPPDLVILDRQLPDMDGLDLCREWRSKPATKALPILFLTSKRSLPDRVVGLQMGGDDYLTKPFGAEELLARVQALLRRALPSQETEGALTDGNLTLKPGDRTAFLKGKRVDLTPKEFDLLAAFLERPGRVLRKDFLLTHVWGYDLEMALTTKVVEVMLSGLRGKLGAWADRIETVRGHGYRLRPADEA